MPCGGSPDGSTLITARSLPGSAPTAGNPSDSDRTASCGPNGCPGFGGTPYTTSGVCSSDNRQECTIGSGGRVVLRWSLGTPALHFQAVSPCRILDTEYGTSSYYGGPVLNANDTRYYTFAQKCGVPADARAVSLNVTVDKPAGQGQLRLYNGDTAKPPTYVLPYVANTTRANNAIVALSDSTTLAVANDGASTHLMIDVNGFFQ
jgi:hypothetical protein